MTSVITNGDSASPTRVGFENVEATSQPASPARMVPALVAGQLIDVQCPAFCTVDHVAFPEGCLEDLGHLGAPADLWMPKAGGDPVFLMSSQLAVHPGDGHPAHVFVDEAEGHRLTADQADEWADSLAAMAVAVRAQAQVLRATKAAR